MKIRKVFVLILLVTALLTSGFTQAAGNSVTISKLEVNIWPEYDRPETLVIYRITLSSDTKLPAQISLRIPRAAGSPYSVAIKDLDGLLYDLEYTLVSEGDWDRIDLITPGSELQVEYYDPGIQIDGLQHTVNFRWFGDYPIQDLTVIVQQPRGAYNLSISPDLGTGTTNPDDNLVYYKSSLGPLDAGTPFNLTLKYDKADNSLSATLVSVKPSGQFPVKQTLSSQASSLLNLILHDRGLLLTGILILSWLVLFLLALWLAGSHLFDRFKRKPKPVEHEEENESSPPVYCPQCGKKAHPGDVYCRVCGGKLPVP